jgi:hypothetical protein
MICDQPRKAVAIGCWTKASVEANHGPTKQPLRRPTDTMKTTTRWIALAGPFLIGCVIVAGVTGCGSTSPSRYISPRVEGRVLDAQTHQPIAGVRVRRLDASTEAAPGEIPRGAQALEQAPEVRTENDGSFAVASQRDLELFRRSGWYSVAISFKHPGYGPFMTNYTPALAIKTPRGEPR